MSGNNENEIIMSPYTIFVAVVLMIILFALKIISNKKKKKLKLYAVDVAKITQISLGISFCFEFLTIIFLSQIGLEFECFRPYPIHLILTAATIFYLSWNNFVDIKIINL